jgi:hypothetical protein
MSHHSGPVLLDNGCPGIDQLRDALEKNSAKFQENEGRVQLREAAQQFDCLLSNLIVLIVQSHKHGAQQLSLGQMEEEVGVHVAKASQHVESDIEVWVI